MTNEYVKLVDRKQSVLLATLISFGLQSRYFQEATGWDYGVRYHKCESGKHYISKEDSRRLHEVVAERVGRGQEFCSDYVHRCTAEAGHLIGTARSLANSPEDAHGREELVAQITSFSEATKAAVPFLAATPAVCSALESLVTDGIAEEAPSNDRGTAARDLSRLLMPSQESEAVREMRNCYRIALEIVKNDEALDLLRNASPVVALTRIETEFPEIYELIRHHLDEYGWLRVHGYGCEPLSPKEVVDRIQVVVVRWNADMIRQAAEPNPLQKTEDVLGFSPSEPLARLVSALQAMTSLRFFRIDVHLQANCIARPFFDRVAEAVGCTPEQLIFSSVDEIVGALTEQSELALPELDRRMRNGFTVERSEDDIRVFSPDTPSTDQERAQPPAATLTGITVCRGRAIGKVKIIFRASDLHKLKAGDVLVTQMSTPDVVGERSVFPARTGAPPGIEKAAAIVTDEGGSLSHAGTISREQGIPCVVGTERATQVLSDGQVVEVDATQLTGTVVALDPA